MKPNWGPGLLVILFMIAVPGMLFVFYSSGLTIPGMKSTEPHTSTTPGISAYSPHVPPDVAVNSCVGKSPGDTCRFIDKDNPVRGSCEDKTGVLSCAPAKALPETATPSVPTPGPDTRPGHDPPGVTNGTFSLTSDAGADEGTMPAEYTCDGSGSTPELSWSGAPAGTVGFALMMTTLPGDGTARWNWVLYRIPKNMTRLEKNSTGVGVLGSGSHGTTMEYDPPCSQGPGPKTYTLTLYALSESPTLPARPELVTGPVLANAISSITLDRASLDLSYTRP